MWRNEDVHGLMLLSGMGGLTIGVVGTYLVVLLNELHLAKLKTKAKEL